MIADSMLTSAAERSRELVRRCWLDSEFRDRLLADPATVLREEGCEAPDEVEVLANAVRARGRTLPSALGVAEVPDSLLGQVYGRIPILRPPTHATRCNNTSGGACCSIGCLLPLPDLN
jgi:hypothetical protein